MMPIIPSPALKFERTPVSIAHLFYPEPAELRAKGKSMRKHRTLNIERRTSKAGDFPIGHRLLAIEQPRDHPARTGKNRPNRTKTK